MKKASTRNNGAHGCMKITSFFSISQESQEKKIPTNNLCLKNTSEIKIVQDSSDRNESPSLLSFKSSFKRKTKHSVEETGKISPIKKISKSTSGTDIRNHLKSNENLQISNHSCFVPSTSGTRPVTPTKSISSVTCPVALKELFKTPEKQKIKTGKKSAGSSSSKSPSCKANKRTPKKLFEKSPNNLDEFNVEVLEKFVKVTPSKKELNQIENEENIRTVSPKKVKNKLDFSDLSLSPKQEKENFDLTNLSCVFDDDISWDCNFLDFTLDLSEFKHCKIMNINRKSTEIMLTVRSTQHEEEQALCSIQGFWMNLHLRIGDTLRIQAARILDNWIINNQKGFLVYEPDLLISVTSVVNSVFCQRRTIFRERFRAFEPTNKFMIIGNMVHNFLEEVLRRELSEYHDINSCASEMLNDPKLIPLIYESGESADEIKADFLIYVPRVFEFISKYATDNKKNKYLRNKDDWTGNITGIEDIEENIWCPELGLKGKVDVTVKNGISTLPIEVKTGRATVSLEHKGQVLLYIMLMNKLNYPVSSGLLLYLKEGILKEVPSSDMEKKHLLNLRNELAYYLTRVPKIAVDSSEGKYLEPIELPEPINHPSCKKCPYNSICMAYSKYTNEDISQKKYLKEVHDELNNFITSVHLEYFMKWSSLLSIEMSERNSAKDVKDIYTLTPEQRKAKGKCLINLRITKIIEEINGICLTTFRSSDLDNFLFSGLTENSYVIVSVENRSAIAAGFISEISMEHVTLSLDRNLRKKYKNQLFYLDSYESSAMLTYNLASLALIVDNSARSDKLRSIIIDKQPATFQNKLPKILAESARPILKRLNKVQQRAILKAVSANDYFLIKGMPGTGKTATIIGLIELLVSLKKTVLITSHTHSAVDTVCLKLIKFNVKFMRLGNEGKINEKLLEYSEHRLTKHCKTAEELEKVFNSVQVLAVTCLGSGHAVLSKRIMDFCIIDESTQVLQCSVFRPLKVAKTFILIGDPDQLPPIVRNRNAIEMGMRESLFERLDSEESRISLNLTYRMNKEITDLANVLTYNGELDTANAKIAKATVNIPKFNELKMKFSKDVWLIEALDIQLKNAVKFIDTGPVWNLPSNAASWAQIPIIYEDQSQSQDHDSQNNINIYEAAIVYRLVDSLINYGKVNADNIGIICTYRSQVALISQLLKKFNIDVSTVDKFQGKDKEIILYSCSKSKDLNQKGIVENKYDLNEDKRRLNVALTRAKHKLILIGDFATLENYSPFKKIKDYLNGKFINLRNYTDDFEWTDILDLDL